MRRIYLVLAVVGYLVPGIPMARESLASGNILFWTDPARTTRELFANGTSTAFVLDLLCVVVVLLLWMTVEARRLGIRHVWGFWALALLLGMAGTLPLFLYTRERHVRARRMPPGSGSLQPQHTWDAVQPARNPDADTDTRSDD